VPEDVHKVLVGNKSDLENERKVTFKEAQDLAEVSNILFFETSAKNATNVEELFLKMANTITENDQLIKSLLYTSNLGVGINRFLSKFAGKTAESFITSNDVNFKIKNTKIDETTNQFQIYDTEDQQPLRTITYTVGATEMEINVVKDEFNMKQRRDANDNVHKTLFKK